MQLSDFIHPDHVFLGVDAPDKDGLIAFLLDAVERSDAFAAQDPAVRRLVRPAILQREGYGTTVLGHRILFPHARVPDFTVPLLLFATCKTPIPNTAVDGEPLVMACLAVMPAERPTLALKVVSALAATFARPEAREFLASAPDPAAVARYLREHDRTIVASVHAHDLCRPYPWTAEPDTPIREIARQLLALSLPGVAVRDPDDGRLLGDITPARLFRHGLPNFFLQLKSVSFIRDFDPFEQYFRDERHSFARDVLDADVSAVDEHATLMEIVHEIAVHGRSLVHVLQGGKPVGFVDAATVLDRVLSP